MRKSTTDRMDDYDAVVIGVLEPILVLSVMAVIIAQILTLLERCYPSRRFAPGDYPT